MSEVNGLGCWLATLLCDGALVPERSYGRRELRQRLVELRPETGLADYRAVVAAADSGAPLGRVEVRCPSGSRISFALDPATRGQVTIHHGDNLALLGGMADGSVDLIYIDPPFNTGVLQARTRIKTARDDEGDRVGFRGERYRSVRLGTRSFADAFDDYLGFLAPRLEEAFRLLSPEGSLFLHLDYREVHYAKVLLDQIFGRASFVNEIIWAYDYGGRTTKRWPAKHDNILWYSRTPRRYCFNYDAIDRIPYMAPGLVGAAKAARGKTPTDTWWHTIVSPGGREKNGYPTQKPLGILNRIVRVHSRPGETILDFFAGSGSIGEAAAMHGRHAILIDRNPEAITVMGERLARFAPTLVTQPEGELEAEGESEGAGEDAAASTLHPGPRGSEEIPEPVAKRSAAETVPSAAEDVTAGPSSPEAEGPASGGIVSGLSANAGETDAGDATRPDGDAAPGGPGSSSAGAEAGLVERPDGDDGPGGPGSSSSAGAEPR